MVSKKNATVPLAIFIGAVANIGLNFWLIPLYGVMGASFATLLSYLLAYAIRAVDIQRLVSLELRPLTTAVRMLLIMVQGALLIRQPPNSFLIQLAMFLLMLALNLRSVLRLGFALFNRFVSPHVSH